MASWTELGVVVDQRLNGTAALTFGATFVVVGLSGFAVSGGHHAIGAEGGLLLGLFQVNLMHNVLHIVLGAALTAAGILGNRPARAANTVIGVGYLALFVVGLFVIGTGANVIALNGADNVLHLGLGTVLTAIGLRADRRRKNFPG